MLSLNEIQHKQVEEVTDSGCIRHVCSVHVQGGSSNVCYKWGSRAFEFDLRESSGPDRSCN